MRNQFLEVKMIRLGRKTRRAYFKTQPMAAFFVSICRSSEVRLLAYKGGYKVEWVEFANKEKQNAYRQK